MPDQVGHDAITVIAGSPFTVIVGSPFTVIAGSSFTVIAGLTGNLNQKPTSMGIFRFKRFNVVNERSAMKVNTDGVLLGAAMTLRPSDRRLLDIGTGTGTIALMAAQRLTDAVLDHTDERSISLDSCGATRMVQDGPEGQTGSKDGPKGQTDSKEGPEGQIGSNAGTDERSIDAVDIDEASAVEAAENFRNSPWSRLLRAFNMSLDQYDGTFSDNRYDLIFSNPPYFEDSLNAPEERRNNARHTSTGLSYREILDFASERLSEDGRVSVVLPAETEAPLCRHARMNGLHLFRIIRVRTVPRKAPSRIIAEFSRKRTDTPEDTVLTIQNEGKYTEEYLSLTGDFYLFA